MVTSVTPLHGSRPWLYDSVAPLGHGWADELTRLETEPKVEERCLGANLAMDARVGTEGQAEWASRISKPPNLYQAVGQQWLQAYVQPRAAVRFTGSPCRLSPKRSLTHVEPFAGLFRRAVGADMSQIAKLDALVGDLTGAYGLVHGLKTPAGLDALAVAIVGLAEDDFRDVVGEALQCIDSQGPRPFWWATLSDEVAGHGDDATKLCSALGLGAYAEADRVLVFDYTVADAGLLYRPTTLDGGGYAFHFPSPVAYPQGLSMALRDTETHCTELLHHALAWDAAADCVRPRVLSLNDAWTRNSVYADLPKQRQRHRLALLVDHPGSKPWLERHHHRL